MLELKNISRTVNGAVHLRGINLRLHKNALNTFLGPTLAGKTTLLRIIAGLEKPDAGGEIVLNGENITAAPVQQRRAAMVYQQFVNYPTMTVLENIASPLVAANISGAEIRRRAEETAELLKLSPFLRRRPAELSGGQQQRVALARALAKDAALVLLDEPLANLDYKLREELREELPKLFARRGGVVAYATADPAEALLLGGQCVAMREGEVLQSGAPAELYHAPRSLAAAEVLSDPPLNTAAATKKDGAFFIDTDLAGDLPLPAPLPPPFADLAEGKYTVAFRAHHLREQKPDAPHLAVEGVVQVAEIAGSESFVHLAVGGQNWIMQTKNLAGREAGGRLLCYIRPQDMFVFDGGGRRVGGGGGGE